MKRWEKKRHYLLKIKAVAFSIAFVMNLFIISGSCDPQETVVSVSPSNLTVSPNESFTLAIFCQPHQAIKSYELSISFDETLLQVNHVIEGDIFDGFTTFFNDGTIENDNGKIIQIYGLIIGPGNVTESGSLVEVTFTSQNSIGSADVGLYNVGITNETSYISVSLTDGSVAIEDNIPLIENESLLFSNPVDTQAAFGWSNISCDIIDNDVSDVKLVLTHPDNSITNTSLNTIDNERFFLNLSGLSYGSYSYYIYVSDSFGNQVCSDVYTFDISPNWDVTMDGTVTLIDLIKISNQYGTTGPHGWIREDVDNNGIVELSDIVLVSNYFNVSWR
jgi:hypothetical protein